MLEDGYPKHTSRLSKGWKADNGVQVLDWPANSPDCNPDWGLMKAKIRKEISQPNKIKEE